MERRLNKRTKVPLGLVPGKLLIESDRREPLFVPIDVDARGLSALIVEPLEVGDGLLLKTDESEIRLTIRRSQQLTKNLWRYWAEAEDPQVDIHAMFEKGGCLDSLDSLSSRGTPDAKQ